MDWPRVKWILIAMLLAGNLLLAFLFLARHGEAGRDEERFRETLLTVLSDRGVTIGPEAEALLFTDARRLYAPRDTAREEALAEALLGPCARSDLGGHIYECANAFGRALFRGGGQLSVVWKEPQSPVAGAMEDGAAALLRRAGFPDDPPPDIRETPDGYEAVLSQSVSGLPVFDADVRLLYEGRSLVSLSGQWVWGVPLPAEGDSPCPVFGAVLLRFVGSLTDADEAVTVVESARLGYILSTLAPDTVCLVPAWLVRADGQDYLIDAETGAPLESAAGQSREP